MKFLATVLMVGVLVSAAGVLLPADPASAAPSKVICPRTGERAIDPITRNPMSHQHVFFGNTTLLGLPDPEHATASQLVGKGTTCQNKDDTAVYWTPTLIYTAGAKAGQTVPIKNFFAYYRCWNGAVGCPVGSHVPQPTDTRIVSGSATNTAPLDTKNFNFTCDERSTRRGPYSDIVAANCAAATGTVYLTAHIDFPTCWDGLLSDHTVAGDTQDSAHFRFPVSRVCPSGFAKKTPELRETVKWDYRGNGSDVALASDVLLRQSGTPVVSGRTLHGDFWQTWVMSGGVQGGYPAFITDCVERNIANQTRCG